uniref:Uncharacterized protein n=1 Tax=Pseudomonas fluorescens (strain SBW25) TaxID=216595 RepID=A0A0G4E6E6_PSEFS|nr:hypothetical protein PQBR55_0143 [Pseudomonas fluorescens SBW25]
MAKLGDQCFHHILSNSLVRTQQRLRLISGSKATSDLMQM